MAGVERFDRETLPLDKLRSRTAEIVLRKGIAVDGTVTDPQGKPAAGVDVGLFPRLLGSDYPRTTTGKNGRFRFAVYEPGEYTLAAAAKGFAPDSKQITIDKQPRTVDLQLRKGEMIRIRVVDAKGRPISKAAVGTVFNNKYREALMLDYESGIRRDNDRHTLADAEGRWSRLWIPNDALTCSIYKEGFTRVERKFIPGEPEQVVVLEPGGWSVAGRVVDRETNRPVTKFRVVEGYIYGDGKSNTTWRDGHRVENPGGRYSASWDTSGNSHRAIRIEADGYLPSEARWLKADERHVTFDVELTKGDAIVGTVRSADGRPADGAEVALCTASRGIYLRNGRPLQGQPNLIVRAGADGRFSLPPQREPYILVVLHDKGFARVEKEADVKEIALQPWARVEGTLRIGKDPGAKETVVLDYESNQPGGRAPFPGKLEKLSPIEQVIKMIEIREIPLDQIPKETLDQIPKETLDRIKEKRRRAAVARRIYFDYQTQTDAEGRFVFERAVPGSPRLKRMITLASEGGMTCTTAARSVPIEASAGRTVRQDIGGTGRPVVGRVAFAEADRRAFDFSVNRVEAERLLPDIPWPEEFKQIPNFLPFRSEEERQRVETEAAKRGMSMPKPSETDIQNLWWQRRKGWQTQWLESDAGKAFRGDRETQFAAKLKPDGSFRLDDLPPGEYMLRASIQTRESMFADPRTPGQRLVIVGSLVADFTVPDVPGGRTDEPLDLGVLLLRITKPR